MAILDLYWIDLIGLVIALWCVNGALTGKFYNHGKGRKRLIAEVRTDRVRLVFLCAGFAIYVLIARDVFHKLAEAGLK